MTRTPARTTAPHAIAVRLLAATMVGTALATGIVGGLVRAGALAPAGSVNGWVGNAVSDHAFLMVCGFLGTVIGFERAVALRHRWAFIGPFASASAALLLLRGAPHSAYWLTALAALSLVGVCAVVVRMQRAPHTVLLLVAALAWALGCLLHAQGVWQGAVIPLWFCFLILTVAAERLEMTRLMRRRPGASVALYALFSTALLGAVLSAAIPTLGGSLFGLSLAGLALWLLWFDIARKTVRAHGLSRYMAVCLLSGYGWMLVAGIAWSATAAGAHLRDVALHALGLGFLLSMVLGHAPVILPAVARVKLRFSLAYYVPLCLLHTSLLVRTLGSIGDYRLLSLGAAGNVVAIALFALTVFTSAMAFRAQHKPTG